MRNAFVEELNSIAAKNRELVVLSGDIGNRLFDTFKSLYPKRFYNCGVAEANMIGLAAGLALTGMTVIVYTITPFVTLRCLEQIRNDVCYHDLPVIIVGVGAGLSYAGLGPSHHSCEDISLMRSLPNMKVICPGDALELRSAFVAAVQSASPVYLRIGKKGEPLVHTSRPHFKIGKAIPMDSGKDICIISTGNVLPMAKELVDNFSQEDRDVSLMSFPTVKPLDMKPLWDVFEKHSLVVSLEEHSYIGGLGSAIAEWMADEEIVDARLLRIGIMDRFFHQAGSQSYARECCGLKPPLIMSRIKQALEKKEMLVC